MSHYLFPDTTVLRNFAVVGELDLLERMLDGRGRWTEAVAYEVERSVPHVPALRAVEERGWLGEPIEVSDPAEMEVIEHLRRSVFGGKQENHLRHLGEAQSCFVVQRWSEFTGSWWISDDRDSLTYARAQGLTAHDTTGLMQVAVRDAVIAPDVGLRVLHDMRAAGRPVRPPVSTEDLLR